MPRHTKTPVASSAALGVASRFYCWPASLRQTYTRMHELQQDARPPVSAQSEAVIDLCCHAETVISNFYVFS